MSLSLVVTVALQASVAIEHVKVELGDGRTLEDGTVVIIKDRIAAVGQQGAAPADATKIDGKGKWLTPGFIDVRSTLGLREVDLEASSVDDTWRDAVMVPGFRALDGFNPLSVRIPVAREEGVTSAVVAPARGVLSGLGHLVALDGSLTTLPDAAQPVALFGDVGSDGAGWSGGSRGGVWLKLREAVADARWYAANKAAYDKNQSRVLSLSTLHLDALLLAVNKKVPLVLGASRASDILAALKFAQAEKMTLVVTGGAEAWLVADALAKAKVPVVLTVSEQVPGSFEALKARDDLAAKLDAAGVPLVIACADFSRRRLRQEAGLAVAYGLPRAKALPAITGNAAKALGLEKELGTVEQGKRADLVLWSGDPLELSSVAEKVFIAGVAQALETRQGKLVQRYLEKVPAAAPKR